MHVYAAFFRDYDYESFVEFLKRITESGSDLRINGHSDISSWVNFWLCWFLTHLCPLFHKWNIGLMALPMPGYVLYAISTKIIGFIYVCIYNFSLCCVVFVDKQLFVVFCVSLELSFENGLCVCRKEKKVCFATVLYWL